MPTSCCGSGLQKAYATMRIDDEERERWRENIRTHGPHCASSGRRSKRFGLAAGWLRISVLRLYGPEAVHEG